MRTLLIRPNLQKPDPFFLPPQVLNDHENSSVYLQTGKPDGTSTVAPMDLEIKSDGMTGELAKIDWQVLRQAVERVVARMHLSSYLKFAVAFAVTNRSAWCVLGKRDETKQTCSLIIERIAYAEVTRLWLVITQKCQQDPTFFLTSDGPLIWASLKSIGFPPWMCQVKWLASSMSRVYAVTMPEYYQWGNNQRILGINVATSCSATYALKVVQSTEDYQREVDALDAVAKETASEKLEFYALGCFEKGTGPKCFQGHTSWANLEVVTPSSRVDGWWEKDFDLNGNGGVIFMRVGINNKTVPWTDLVDGVSESLRLAHKAGYLHCDVRRSNIMKFGNKWCLIDFGLSCKLEDPNNYDLEPGAQADSVGPRVKGCYRRNCPIHYTIGDDYEMLLTMMKGWK